MQGLEAGLRLYNVVRTLKRLTGIFLHHSRTVKHRLVFANMIRTEVERFLRGIVCQDGL